MQSPESCYDGAPNSKCREHDHSHAEHCDFFSETSPINRLGMELVCTCISKSERQDAAVDRRINRERGK